MKSRRSYAIITARPRGFAPWNPRGGLAPSTPLRSRLSGRKAPERLRWAQPGARRSFGRSAPLADLPPVRRPLPCASWRRAGENEFPAQHLWRGSKAHRKHKRTTTATAGALPPACLTAACGKQEKFSFPHNTHGAGCEEENLGKGKRAQRAAAEPLPFALRVLAENTSRLTEHTRCPARAARVFFRQ